MKGLIKKDLLMIKNNYKFILISLVIYIFYYFQFEMNMTFFLPFIGLMVCISTISYDDFNNFHTYASSLPQGKVGFVKSKYITTIGVTTLLSAFSLLISFVIGKFNLVDESFSEIIGVLFAMYLMMSILFPILFKYGAEKGRTAMLLVGLFIFGIMMLVTKFINIEISESIINFLDLYFPIIIAIISILMIYISYLISKKIYLKREF